MFIHFWLQQFAVKAEVHKRVTEKIKHYLAVFHSLWFSELWLFSSCLYQCFFFISIYTLYYLYINWVIPLWFSHILLFVKLRTRSLIIYNRNVRTCCQYSLLPRLHGLWTIVRGTTTCKKIQGLCGIIWKRCIELA